MNHNRKPLLVILLATTMICLMFSPANAAGAGWVDLGGSLNGTVWSSTVDPTGNLYIGGDFTTNPAGNPVGYVTKWNKTSWEGLGLGTNGAVMVFRATDAANIFTGGAFTKVGGKTVSKVVNRIVRWDGAGWNYMDAGANNTVFAIAGNNRNKMFVGGSFGFIGKVFANNVAQWNQSKLEWQKLKSGTNGTIYAMTMDPSGILYVGGKFTSAGGIAVNNIAKWNGTNWAAVGTGTNGTIRSMEIDPSGKLIVGGLFTTAGGKRVNGIAKWDGTSWSDLGTGVSSSGKVGTVYSIQTNGSNIYIAGTFTEVGGVTVNNIAMWNGTTWSAIGTGIGGPVYSISLNKNTNQLYAAGAFSKDGSGTIPLNRLALFDLSSQ